MVTIPHILFFVFNGSLFLLLFLFDKKNKKKYIVLSILGLLLAYIFETTTTWLGFWYYHSEPKIPLISLYTWLLYVPYLSFCYFISNKLSEIYV